MKSKEYWKEYWKKRAEQVAGRQFKKTDDYIVEQDMMYQEALYSIRQDIETFYQRFADNNQISLNEARKLLDSNELSEFHMGLKKFIKLAKDINHERWEKELNNASYKVRISRLQALEMQIINTIEELYIKQQEGTTELLGDIYDDTYHRNIYEIGKGLNLVTDFKKVDTSMIDNVLNETWLGENFSSRIWNDKEKLIRELRVNLTQSFIRGDPIDKTSKIIAERMGVAKNRARTLVNTESAHITSQATFDSYEGSGVVKQYEILATLDLHTSKICRSMDGKVFNLSEKERGINAPPFHPNCRTTVVSYFDDMDTYLEQRIARDPETGKSYYEWSDMTYEKWYEKQKSLKGDLSSYEKKIKNKSSDKKQFEKYKEILGKEVPNSFDKFQDLKYNNSEKWEELKNNFRDTNRYNKIIKEVDSLNIKGIPIKNINRVNLNEYKFDFNHINNERQHGVTKEMAQEFINNSKAAYSRWNGQVVLYISDDGCTLINLKDKNVRTAYTSSEYDEKFNKLLEVLKDD